MRFFYGSPGMNVPELYKVFLKHPVISTDTRIDITGSLFFALRGERFNGNEFAREALSKGAAFAVVDEGDFSGHPGFIQVEDCLETLQQLAQYHREQLNATLIAITGSNGKTTTKELAREVLAKKYKVYATEGNLNNHIGVPLSLLRIREDVQFGIIEMGANHIGEIEQLCHIASPDYGIITNIGRAHIEGFGSLEGVKKAKGELYDYLSGKNRGVFLNADNNTLVQMVEGFVGEIIKYGDVPNALCHGYVKGHYPNISFNMSFITDPGNEHSGSSRLVGSYNLENILASACIGRFFDVGSAEILEAIREYDPKQITRPG